MLISGISKFYFQALSSYTRMTCHSVWHTPLLCSSKWTLIWDLLCPPTSFSYKSICSCNISFLWSPQAGYSCCHFCQYFTQMLLDVPSLYCSSGDSPTFTTQNESGWIFFFLYAKLKTCITFTFHPLWCLCNIVYKEYNWEWTPLSTAVRASRTWLAKILFTSPLVFPVTGSALPKITMGSLWSLWQWSQPKHIHFFLLFRNQFPYLKQYLRFKVFTTLTAKTSCLLFQGDRARM